MYDTKPNRLAWHSGVSRFAIYVIWRRQRLSRLDRLAPQPSVIRRARLFHRKTATPPRIRVQIERRLVPSGQ